MFGDLMFRGSRNAGVLRRTGVLTPWDTRYMKPQVVIFSRGMKCDGCLADGGKEIYKLEQNVLLNRYCLAFWIFLPRIEGDIKTFWGLLPVKLQMFCAYQITLSNTFF